MDLTPAEIATIESAKAILARLVAERPVITSWHGLTDYLTIHLGGRSKEAFHVLFLDSKNRLIADVEMGNGTVDHVPVYPREVIAKALELNASALILAHNHPSGDPTPSDADVTMTREIAKACKFMRITLHDHVVVGAGNFHSMRASGAF